MLGGSLTLPCDDRDRQVPSSGGPVLADAPEGLPIRTRAALFLGRAAATLSRACGAGDGAIIGGRVTLRVDRDALRRVAAGRRVVLVTGTNGKTTTSHMLAAALRTVAPVAHNATGANMPDGVAAALGADRTAPYAVCEVDELHLGAVAAAVHPAAIVLLNLSRDQLDRANEVRRTEAVIAAAIAAHPDAQVIANADDPIVVWAARNANRPIWVGAGTGWQGERACPRCGHTIHRTRDRWYCACGLARPDNPPWSVDPRLRIALPGRANRANAAMALAAAGVMGVDAAQAAAAVGALSEIDGRYRVVHVGTQVLRVLLAKNPAGWTEMLAVLSEQPRRPVLIAVNARAADGEDTSWLWDVPFEQLRGHPVVAAGEAAADLGVRLSYAEVAHRLQAEPLAALSGLPAGPVDVVATYSAFRQLTRKLGRAR